MEIRPDGSSNRFYLLLTSPPPGSVRLLHVLWSGEAFFFSVDLREPPTQEEMTDRLEPGSVTWFPQLRELIIAYGTAAPRDQHGAISVAKVGRIDDLSGLREIGRRIWMQGAEAARLVLTLEEPAMNGKKHLN